VTDDDQLLGTLIIDGDKIAVTAQKDPAKLQWKKLAVQIVLEATGQFLTKEAGELHLQAGAKKVLFTAPAKSDDVSTAVIGVNELDYSQNIFSNASCTTNCIAPVVKILNDTLGIKKAMLTTVHAYTDDQNLLDNSHKKDLRRARSAANNIVPTSTGAAKTTAKIIPELKGVFDGIALRVPNPVGSLSDLVMVTKQKTTVKEVNSILTKAADKPKYFGVLAVSSEPIVSSDIVGRSESAIVDLELTQVIGDNLVKVICWYDNEWGYCARLLDQLVLIPVK
jgi:glyceraldehyde 3-phosphate dehydrogenase